MRFKGIELPVNSVIVIALAIFVLLMLAAFFSKSGSEMDRTQVQNAFNQGCYQLSTTYDCREEGVDKIMTGLIKDNKALNLAEVCKNYLGNMLASSKDCVKACPQCGQKYATSGTPCPNGNEDCKSPYGDLTCMSGICCAGTDTVVNGHCKSSSSATCSSTNKGACTSRSDCTTAGGTWHLATTTTPAGCS